MHNPGAAAFIFAFVFLVHHHRQLLIPVLETVERSGLAKSIAGLLMARGGRGRSVVRGARLVLGGAYAPRSEDEPRPRSFGSHLPVSASAREPPNYVAAPTAVVLAPD